jgi:hypothetical protein
MDSGFEMMDPPHAHVLLKPDVRHLKPAISCVVFGDQQHSHEDKGLSGFGKGHPLRELKFFSYTPGFRRFDFKDTACGALRPVLIPPASFILATSLSKSSVFMIKTP